MELGAEQILRRLHERVQLVGVVRDSRDALVRLDADQDRSAVGIGHARKHPDDFPSQIFLALFLPGGAAILVGADEFEKLPALLLEQEPDFFRLHNVCRRSERTSRAGSWLYSSDNFLRSPHSSARLRARSALKDEDRSSRAIR